MPALSAMTLEPGQRDSASRIDDGEKYAVIALSVPPSIRPMLLPFLTRATFPTHS